MNSQILVIEDSTDIKENIAELLGLSGYDVKTAHNGLVGLDLAHKCKPDLILCDIMMPILDGYGVLRAIRNVPELEGTPFVFLTGKHDQCDFRNAMDMGADDYLTKPFTGDELLRVVETRLKKSRALKQNTIASNPCLAKLSGEHSSMKDILGCSLNHIIKKVRAKQTIYIEGDSATHFFILISGRVKLYKTNDLGKEYITEIVNEGGSFGFQALIDEHQHKHSAMAIENTELALIPRQTFIELVTNNHEIALKLIKMLSDNMAEYEDKLINLAYGTARKRVADALLFIFRQYYCDEMNGGSFPASRENLSAIAGISPESVSRNLSDFRSEKLIATDNGNVTILDLKKLLALQA